MPQDLHFEESISVVKTDVRRIEKKVDDVVVKAGCNEVEIAKMQGALAANEERSRDNQKKIDEAEKRIDTLDRASVSMEALTTNMVKNMSDMSKHMENMGGVVSKTVDHYHELDKSVMKTSIKVGIILSALGYIAANFGAIVSLFR